MIRVRLAGGLGNQLFQIAAGLTLRYQTNESLSLVTGHLVHYTTKRPFYLSEVEEFKHMVSSSVPWKMAFLSKYRLTKLLQNILPWVVVNKNIQQINKQGNYWVDDYFQQIDIIKSGFENLTAILQWERDRRKNIRDKYLELRGACNDDEIVAIHVRKGDYLSAKNKKIFFELDQSYYHEALKRLPASVKKIVLFEATGKSDIQFPGTYEIASTATMGLDDLDEFFLMSSFKNIVIANSTFSFWAAVVGKNGKNILVGPANWTYKRDDNHNWNINLRSNNFNLVG